MHAPPFTTHGISMDRRLLILVIVEVVNDISPGVHNIIAGAPKPGEVAPPVYYPLSVVYRGVPSVSMLAHIK